MARKTKLAAVKDGSGRLHLNTIRLFESHTTLGLIRPDGLPGQAVQHLNVAMATPVPKFIAVKIDARLETRYDGESADSAPAFSVSATFVAEYAIVEDFQTEEQLHEVTHRIGILGIWPYWREFVQSMTTRMGVPAFHVPLFYMDKVGQAENAKKKRG